MNAEKPNGMPQGRGTFLKSLACDRSGNTLAMMAAFLIPMLALAGSAVDMGRQYMVKVRLQQACDAGALAGRKFMSATTGSTLDSAALTQANEFFENNFVAGWMGSTSVSFSPTRTSDSQVAATATATVPMTVMKMFGRPSMTHNVTCQARFDIADTDVMFVLDNTGSMACLASEASCSQSTSSYTRSDGTIGYAISEKTGSKMTGIRDAVLIFWDTLNDHAPPGVHIRYGFVPYTSTTNVGSVIYGLDPSYLVDSWTYNTRTLIGDSNNGSYTDNTTTNTTSAACDALVGRSPAAGYNTDGRANVMTKVSWSSSSSGTCVIRTQPVKPNWRYQDASIDVSTFKTFATVNDPTKITGATSKWQGCIEERDTTASTSFNVNSLPADLNPDLVPTSDGTRWRPLWPEVSYYRPSASASDNSGSSTNPYGDSTNSSATSDYTHAMKSNNHSSGYYTCPKAAKRLGVMTRTEVSNFVNHSDFKAHGGTYHDTGMIWGTRMISPTGIFAADTAAWPGNVPPNRFIVFMSDGQMAPAQDIYGMYGIESLDGRVTGSTISNQTANHNARFLAACAAAKARNITVFVVAFGTSLSSDMSNCASPGAAFQASSNAALGTAFSSIAMSVAALRLSQ